MWRARIMGMFAEDLPLKLASLLIAGILFVIVRSDKDATTGAYVKVIYTLPPERVLVSDLPSEVRVLVRGMRTRLQALDPQDIEPIQVDLSRMPGLVHFDPGMVHLPAGMRAASVTPAEVRVSFEQRLARDVPIQPVTEGEPAEGFRVARLNVHPDRARIDGAKRTVEAVARVGTRPLKIDGASATVRGEVGVEVGFPHVEIDSPSKVTVEAIIVPALVEYVLEGVPVRGGSMMEPAVVEVILRGPGDVVRQVQPTQLSVHAVPGQRGVAMVRLMVTGVPPGVAAEVRPDTVRIRAR